MDSFKKIYLNIINELIDQGRQSNSDFPKLNNLKFYKIYFRIHAVKNDAERDVTKGNSKWLYKIIDDTISNVLTSIKYLKYFEKYNYIVTFSIFTNYYDLTQIPIEVNLKERKITLITLISNLSKQRYDRLTSVEYFFDENGRFNIPIKV